MAIAQEDLLAATREALRDTSKTTWTDEQLGAAMNAAVAEYSRQWPVRAGFNETGVTTAGRHLLVSLLDDVTADDDIAAIEWPIDQWPPSYVRFDQWGDTLTLHADRELAADDVRFWVKRPHTLSGDTWTDLPAADLELLASGSAAFAQLSLATESTNTVTLQPHAAEQLRRLASEGLTAFRNAIRNRTVVQGTAYRPDEPYRLSRFTDPGPQ